MSGQGANSTKAGLLFEQMVADLLTEHDHVFERQVRRWSTRDGYRPKHDILLHTPTGDVVIECKWFGDKPGSMPDSKLFGAIAFLSRLPTRSLIVLGGPGWERPGPSRMVRWAKQDAARSPIEVLMWDELEGWIHAEDRR